MSVDRWKKIDASSDLEDIAEQVELWFRALEIQAEEWQINVLSRLIQHQCHMVEPNLNAPEPHARKLVENSPEIVGLDEVVKPTPVVYRKKCLACEGTGVDPFAAIVMTKGTLEEATCEACKGEGVVFERTP